jgi:hypothetical protein
MTTSNGINGGKNAGRICWLIAHTMCEGETETTFEEMIKICSECDFMSLLSKKRGKNWRFHSIGCRKHMKKTGLRIKSKS